MKHILLFSILIFLSVVTFAEEQLRIVSLAPAITETIVFLGGEKYLVGRSSACNYPESVMNIPVAGDFAIANIEQILIQKPTHFFANDMMDPKIAELLKKAGVQCRVRQCGDIANYKDWVAFLGKCMGVVPVAEAELKRVDEKMTELKKLSADMPEKERKSAIWVIWHDPLLLGGKGSLLDTIIHEIGLKNCAREVSPEYFRASFEWLLLQDPDYIIWPDITPERKKSLSKEAVWKQLRAVKNGNIIDDINPDIILRPGPRFFDGMFSLREKIIPPNL